ncbi:MAG: 3-keto-5-aminohexanoate cleavage protein [Deltaproteobacteria bacterium]|nr:3-keto-5-aminohexanoate cleavage protein [Deltaproteobacteria bacterium]MBI3294686.1 3-keto-5-aminohexanoate cleavage protein [Deltaproteobacteria bacterium]
MEELIITCAITGAEIDKSQHPQLPVTPGEQAEAVVGVVEAGASVIHIHVRDDEYGPSQELRHFERSFVAIRSAVKAAGLEQPILQISTGGAVGEKMERRIQPLTLKPEMASFNLGTMNFGNDTFVNTRPDMRALAKAFRDNGVVPEFEIYDLGHIDELHSLIKEGAVDAPYHVQFVLGVPGGALPFGPEETTGKRVEFLISQLPQPFSWGIAGVGRFERPCAEIAVRLGGNVRVGLEDNLYLRKGVLAKNNAELVTDIACLAKSLGRSIASVAEARAILFPKK